MRHEDLPERWKLKVIGYLRSIGEDKRDKLSAYELNSASTVQLKFEDDSFAKFRYSLVINAPELNEGRTYTYYSFNACRLRPN